jgi:hypothetical protein
MGNARLHVARRPRLIFYANELIGLGHVGGGRAAVGQRVRSELVDSHWSAIEPTFQLPPRVDTVKLPGLGRDQGTRQYSARVELNPDELLSLRSRIALASATSFRPDVAVIDKLPLGQGLLTYARPRGAAERLLRGCSAPNLMNWAHAIRLLGSCARCAGRANGARGVRFEWSVRRRPRGPRRGSPGGFGNGNAHGASSGH